MSDSRLEFTDRRSAHLSSRVRGGFTLFELMLALGLSVVLLTAISTALHLYWNYSTAGQERMKQSQLVRALLEQIKLDVRSVVFRATDLTDSTGATFELASSSDNETTRVEVQQQTDRQASTEIGIVGDDQRLLLQVSRARRQSHGDNQDDFDPSKHEIVVWQVVDDGFELAHSGDDERPESGIARISADGLSIDTRTASSVIHELAAGRGDGKILAKEVKAMNLRYWDGRQWLAKWDSVEERKLPRAIEIAIEFGPTDSTLQQAKVYRAVLPINLSEPKPESSLVSARP